MCMLEATSTGKGCGNETRLDGPWTARPKFARPIVVALWSNAEGQFVRSVALCSTAKIAREGEKQG